MGFLPVTPSSATTQRGAPAPLWKPPHILQSLCSTVEAPRRDCPPESGVQAFFANGRKPWRKGGFIPPAQMKS